MPFDFLKSKSKQTVTRYPTDFLLGDLLLKAGVVTQAQLDEAVKLAGAKHHVGQMLIMAGYLSPRDLQAAVDAQSMLRDRTIEQSMAHRCLKIARKTGMSFADVVRDQEAGSSEGTSNKLGELLLEAGLVDHQQLAKSMQRSLATGLPLGRILVLNGSLPESILTLTLEMQVRIRDGMMSREEALENLRSAGGLGETIDETETLRLQAVLTPPRRKGLRLGELLVLAGLLQESDVMNALEIGLSIDQKIGEVLVNGGYLTNELLDAALELQRRVDDDRMEPMEAGEVLSRFRATGEPIGEIVEQIEAEEEDQPRPLMEFDKLLVMARVITEEDIESAVEQVMKSPQILSKVLHMTGYIDDGTLQAVLQCYTMLSNGFLTQDDAVVTLDYCLHKSPDNRVAFADALAELGWNAMMPLQMQGATAVDISQVRLSALSKEIGGDEEGSADEQIEAALSGMDEVSPAYADGAAELESDVAESGEEAYGAETSEPELLAGYEAEPEVEADIVAQEEGMEGVEGAVEYEGSESYELGDTLPLEQQEFAGQEVYEQGEEVALPEDGADGFGGEVEEYAEGDVVEEAAVEEFVDAEVPEDFVVDPTLVDLPPVEGEPLMPEEPAELEAVSDFVEEPVAEIEEAAAESPPVVEPVVPAPTPAPVAPTASGAKSGKEPPKVVVTTGEWELPTEGLTFLDDTSLGELSFGGDSGEMLDAPEPIAAEDSTAFESVTSEVAPDTVSEEAGPSEDDLRSLFSDFSSNGAAEKAEAAPSKPAEPAKPVEPVKSVEASKPVEKPVEKEVAKAPEVTAASAAELAKSGETAELDVAAEEQEAGGSAPVIPGFSLLEAIERFEAASSLDLGDDEKAEAEAEKARAAAESAKAAEPPKAAEPVKAAEPAKPTIEPVKPIEPAKEAAKAEAAEVAKQPAEVAKAPEVAKPAAETAKPAEVAAQADEQKPAEPPKTEPTKKASEAAKVADSEPIETSTARAAMDAMRLDSDLGLTAAQSTAADLIASLSGDVEPSAEADAKQSARSSEPPVSAEELLEQLLQSQDPAASGASGNGSKSDTAAKSEPAKAEPVKEESLEADLKSLFSDAAASVSSAASKFESAVTEKAQEADKVEAAKTAKASDADDDDEDLSALDNLFETALSEVEAPSEAKPAAASVAPVAPSVTPVKSADAPIIQPVVTPTAAATSAAALSAAASASESPKVADKPATASTELPDFAKPQAGGMQIPTSGSAAPVTPPAPAAPAAAAPTVTPVTPPAPAVEPKVSPVVTPAAATTPTSATPTPAVAAPTPAAAATHGSEGFWNDTTPSPKPAVVAPPAQSQIIPQLEAQVSAAAAAEAKAPVEKPAAAPEAAKEAEAKPSEAKPAEAKPAAAEAPAAKPVAAEQPKEAAAAVASKKEPEVPAAVAKAAGNGQPAASNGEIKAELKNYLDNALTRLADSYYEQGEYEEAQNLFERILVLRENQLGPTHLSLSTDLTNLAGVLCVQGRFVDAEPFVKRVVSILENQIAVDPLKLADSLNTLAGVLFQQGKFSECEPHMQRALLLKQETLGHDHLEVADNLRDLAKLLKKLGRDTDAERYYSQAKAIIAKHKQLAK